MSAEAHQPFEQCSPEEQERLIEAALAASQEEVGGVSDPGLREAVGEQRQIDGALERLFIPPASDRVMQAIRDRIKESESDPSTPIVRTERAWWQRTSALSGLAASLVMTTIGVWLIVNALSGHEEHGEYVTRHGSFFDVYREEKALGFKEQWLCDTDEEFASYFYLDFKQGILLDAMPEGIAMLGLSYSDTMSDETITMLGEVHGEDVMLFIDLLENDPGAPEETPDGLNIFRRELDPLVIYEVTPLDEMLLAPFVRPIEMPEEWLPQGPGG